MGFNLVHRLGTENLLATVGALVENQIGNGVSLGAKHSSDCALNSMNSPAAAGWTSLVVDHGIHSTRLADTRKQYVSIPPRKKIAPSPAISQAQVHMEPAYQRTALFPTLLDMADSSPQGLIVLYDADCRFCTSSARLLRAIGEPHGLRIEPLQSPRWRALVSDGTDEMKLVREDGSVIGGGDALIEVSRRLPVLAGLWVWTFVPGIPWLIRRVYRWIAHNRGCDGGACRLG